MRLDRLASLALAGSVALALGACSGGGGSPQPAGTPVAGSAAPSAQPSAAAVRIAVTLTDKLTIEPAAMTVPAGVPVTFVVTNTGAILHEFVLGDEADQAEHEQEMIDDGGMSMPEDEPMAIGVDPGKTKELTVTFTEPGQLLAGCHVVGHYAGGMKATVTVG